MNLARIRGNKDYRTGPIGTTLALDPGWLRISELDPSDCDPGTGWLNFLDAEDRDFGGCAASESSVLKLLPHTLCVCIPGPSTAYFEHPPQGQHPHEHDKYRSDCHQPRWRWPIREGCRNQIERAQAN